VLTVYVVSHPLTFLKTFVLLLFLACLEPETKVLLFYASGLIIISPCMKLFSLINILMLWPFSLSLPVGCLLIYIIKLKLMFFFFQICCIKHADERYNCRCSSSAKASGNNLGMCKGIPWACLLFFP
jgi:hypothetical protein